MVRWARAWRSVIAKARPETAWPSFLPVLRSPCATGESRPSGRSSFVAMVEAADLAERHHVSVGDRLHWSRGWRIFRQREVGPRVVVVSQVCGERAPEMRLVQDDDVVETLASNGSDQAFD